MPVQMSGGMLQMGSSGGAVSNLQNGLNQKLPNELPKLVADGIFGMKTKGRVVRFQQLNGLVPDGIVGPKTLAKLGVGSAPGMPPAPGAPPSLPGLPTPPAVGAARFTAEMRQEFDKQGKSNLYVEFVNDFENNTLPTWKAFLGAISRAEDARKIASFYIALRNLGLSGSQLSTVLGETMKLNKDALTFFDAVSAPAGKFSSALKVAGSVANVIGLITTAIECILHARRGDYSPIPAEIYKYFMGNAIPWAGLIEGIGSLLDGVLPQDARNTTLYKVLRSIDPVGLGAVAIDSVGSLATGAFEMLSKGQASEIVLMPRLKRLVDRMKQGPANIFAELGGNCGEALFRLSQSEFNFEELMTYSFSELKNWIMD